MTGFWENWGICVKKLLERRNQKLRNQKVSGIWDSFTPRGETENPRWAWIINPGADTLRNWWWRIRAQLDPGLGRRGCLPRRRQRLSAHKTQRLGDADQLRHGVSHRAASIIVWKTPLRRRHRQWQWRGLLWDFWGGGAAGWSWTATYAMIRSHQERSLRWT